MQTPVMVARALRCCEPLMHASRLRALRDTVCAAVCGRAVKLTSLALGLSRATTLRHRIKCVDRLLANAKLDAERAAVYCALAHMWLADLPQVLIVVDWSSLTDDLKWHWLRASVVVEGRSVTLYEEVHPRCKLTAKSVHQRFVRRLAELLPPTRQPPIVVTDAGFRTTWFRMIDKQEWYWLGRTRNRDFVRQDGGDWIAAKSLYTTASAVPKDLGEYEAVRNCPLRCRFALVKHQPSGRKHRYPTGKVKDNANARKNAQCNREPWLLSYSPALAYLGAEAIVRLYAQRMTIEQAFRDSKNIVLGMGLSTAKSRGKRSSAVRPHFWLIFRSRLYRNQALGLSGREFL